MNHMIHMAAMTQIRLSILTQIAQVVSSSSSAPMLAEEPASRMSTATPWPRPLGQ